MLEELRQLTRDSIEAGNKQRAKEEAAANARFESAMAQNRLWAEDILLTIPGLCKQAATKGKTSIVLVSSCKDGIYSIEQFNRELAKNDPRALKYQMLIRLLEVHTDLKVKLTDGHDGVGIESWINICVSWD
jgi:hypothetical protein